MPAYKLLRDTIQITASPDDPWEGTTTGHEIRDGALICGPVYRCSDGQEVRLILRLSDKPELMAMLAELNVNRQARAARIASIPGIADLREAQQKYEDAGYAYHRASEHGYPPREAARAREADDILCTLRARYQDAARYLQAESWTCAANYAKVAAGRRAVERIEDGEDISVVIAEMEADWSEAARRAVENS